MPFTNAWMYSALLIGILILTFCAGCSEQSETTKITPMPTITSNQPKFIEGDIITKTASSTDLFLLILNYDSANDTYERAFVNKKSDGSWFRSNNISEFADRTLMEKLYPAKVGHVNSLSQTAVETPSKNILSTPTPALTPALTLTPSVTQVKTDTLTPQPDPIVGTWTFTNSFEENGTRMNVVCSHQFVSWGNFSHSCAGPGEPAQEPDYGQWENLGDNLYVIMYPDGNNPEQPYGFYEGFYYNLSYNPESDTLTLVDETIVLERVKNA
jgi:hypothetical protein